MDNTNQAYLDQAKEILANKSALCFEGGGVLGIGHVGALSRLSELGGLKKITHVTGASVGSILAAAFGCGATMEYVQHVMFGLDVTSFKDTSKCIVKDLYRFFKKYGWYKCDAVENLAGEIMKDLTGNSDITFLEAFNKFGIKLTITYLSVNFSKSRYANHITEPNLQIKKAVRRSAAIPVFYQAVWDYKSKNKPELFVDGGVTDSYPIHVLKEQHCPLKDILAFKLCSSVEFNEYKEDMKEPFDEIDDGVPKNIYTYVMKLIGIVHNQALRYHVHTEDWKVTTKIDIGTLTTTDFNITEDQKQWLYNQGKVAIDKHLDEIVEMLKLGTYPL